jgi:hypothetical protein
LDAADLLGDLPRSRDLVALGKVIQIKRQMTGRPLLQVRTLAPST